MARLDEFVLGIGLSTICIATFALTYGRLKQKEWFTVGARISAAVGVVGGISAVFWTLRSSRLITNDGSENLTFVLAVSAILFAIWQFRDSQEQEIRMKCLAGQMSTRFIGYFPNNLPDINEVVEHARETLDIMSDYVGYGHFSDPEGFQRYFRNLQDLAAKQVRIRMLVYSRDEAEKTYATQFMSPGFVGNLQKNIKRLMHYCEVFSCGLSAEFIEKLKAVKESDTQAIEQLRQEFSGFMFDRQLVYMKDLMERGIEIKQINDKLPFFLWCEDEHEAIFGFLNEHAANEREVTFRTRDASLIDHTFKVKFKAYWDEQAIPITMALAGGHREPSWFPTVSNAAGRDLTRVA